MRLAIRHTTRYSFQGRIVHGLQRLRLMPKETQGQKILDWSMEYEGAREELSYDDQNHNHVTLVSAIEGAEQVVVTCRGTVETQDHAGVIGHHAGHLPIWSFLAETPLTKIGPKLRQLIAGVERSDEGMVATLHNLGWVGFDISNGISPDPRYVRVATGRDYRDAAPITGISFGAATENLTVDLAVEQQTQDQ